MTLKLLMTAANKIHPFYFCFCTKLTCDIDYNKKISFIMMPESVYSSVHKKIIHLIHL